MSKLMAREARRLEADPGMRNRVAAVMAILAGRPAEAAQAAAVATAPARAPAPAASPPVSPLKRPRGRPKPPMLGTTSSSDERRPIQASRPRVTKAVARRVAPSREPKESDQAAHREKHGVGAAYLSADG
jgi:hypothetical protein